MGGASKVKPAVSFPFRETVQAARNAKDMAEAMLKVSEPGTKAGVQSILELIKSGGAEGGGVPLIQKAIAAMRQGQQRSLTTTDEALARGGVTGDLAASIRNPLEARSTSEIQGFGPRTAVQYITAAAQAGLTGGQQGILGLGASAEQLGRASAAAGKREASSQLPGFGENLGKALSGLTSEKIKNLFGNWGAPAGSTNIGTVEGTQYATTPTGAHTAYTPGWGGTPIGSTTTELPGWGATGP